MRQAHRRRFCPLAPVALVGLLLASAGVVGQEEPTAALWRAWFSFLGSEGIFGDYADSLSGGTSLGVARRLVYETVGPDTGNELPLPSVRLAARALWIGTNLEYQAMLTDPDDPVPPGAGGSRDDHAWRVLALGRRLRELVDRTPPTRFEPDDALAVARWEQALLRLDAMVAEAAEAVPYTPIAPRRFARDAVLAEFSPERAGGTGSTNPNALLMSRVGGAFRVYETLAKSSAASATQAALVLGKIYGFPPDVRRQTDQEVLAPAEAAGDSARAGLYPPRGAEWDTICRAVLSVYGGGDGVGVVNAYADARRVLNLTPLYDALSKAGSGYPEPIPVLSPYRLDLLVTLANRLRHQIINRLPRSTAGLPPFGEFTIDQAGLAREGGLAAYLESSKTSGPGARSAASDEVARLREEWAKLGPIEDMLPLKEADLESLVEVAVNVQNILPNDARSLVRKLVERWLLEQVDRRAPRLVEFTGRAPSLGEKGGSR